MLQIGVLIQNIYVLSGLVHSAMPTVLNSLYSICMWSPRRRTFRFQSQTQKVEKGHNQNSPTVFLWSLSCVCFDVVNNYIIIYCRSFYDTTAFITVWGRKHLLKGKLLSDSSLCSSLSNGYMLWSKYMIQYFDHTCTWSKCCTLYRIINFPHGVSMAFKTIIWMIHNV